MTADDQGPTRTRTAPPTPQQCGRAYLVGAGPGDPGLIALRGAELLGRADLVLYDYLVNPQLLAHVRPGTQTVCLGRHGRDRIVPQSEINERLVAEALAGKTVVRLKGGDPAIFGRLSEEVAALEAAGVPYEIVPGITAALAAGSFAGVQITDRGRSSAVALVTGREAQEETSSLDYGALAAFPGTLVFYMGVTSAPVWTAALLAAGKAADTPCAIVRRCTWPDQTIWSGTLATVVDILETNRVRPPVVVIVGEVASATSGSWFASRPLFGERVLVTRPAEPHDPMTKALQELGADVIEQPAIVIEPPEDWTAVDRVLARLNDFDWLVFSSGNGVRSLLDRLMQAGDLRQLAGVRLAAIGPGTAAALASYHLRADLMPEEFRAEGLVRSLAPHVSGKRLLLARASRGREVLAEGLRAAGGHVEQVVVYRSLDIEQPDPEAAHSLAAGRITWATVTSSAIARSLAQLYGDGLRKVQLASISPITSATLRELGFEPAAEANPYTTDGLVEAIRQVCSR